MPRHIYFVAPEKSSPTGGINVMFQFAEILRDHGQSVSIHFASSDFVYPYFDSDVETTYSPYKQPLPPIYRAPGSHLTRLRNEWRKSRRRGANRRSAPGRDDLVFLPDFAAAKQLGRFPVSPIVVLAQDVSGSIRGSLLPRVLASEGWSQVKGYLTTSRAAGAAVAAFSPGPQWNVPLALGADEFGFVEEKRRQICFLHRKRAEEVSTLHAFLRRSSEIINYDFIPIRNLPTSEVRRIMAESLFFLSFSRDEGFGLPPAEAMAMGCITIGYTGVGGNEYFTPDIAFPVPEDDTVAFYRKVIEVVQAYDANPAPLDAMRRKASERILGTYTKENTTRALLKAIEEIAK